jgi:FkbM family methyltransferase
MPPDDIARLLEPLRHLLDGDFFGAMRKIDQLIEGQVPDNRAAAFRSLIVNEWIRHRQSKLGGLQRLRQMGYAPETVIDVGAQIGTPELFKCFPDAMHLLIEPVGECLAPLETVKNQLARCIIEQVAVSSLPGSSNLSISESLQYSSIFHSAGPLTRLVKIESIDSLITKHKLEPPFALKIDIDGGEVRALRGGARVLNDNRSVVIVETTFCDEDARFSPVISLLREFDFSIFDIVDFLYRPSDHALWQVDLIAISKSSPHWGGKRYLD